LGDQIEKNEMGGARSTYGDRRVTYRILVGKPEGKREIDAERSKILTAGLQNQLRYCIRH
jgi:hypothetical protein